MVHVRLLGLLGIITGLVGTASAARAEVQAVTWETVTRDQAQLLKFVADNDCDEIEKRYGKEEEVFGYPMIERMNKYNKQLLQTRYDGHFDYVKNRNEISVTNKTPFSNHTLLHVAARFGSTKTARWLIENGYATFTATEKSGATALYVAAGWGRIETVSALLELYEKRVALFKAHRTIYINIQCSTGRTALHAAACEGQLECVRALCDAGADINIRTNSGALASTLARNKGYIEVAEYLEARQRRDPSPAHTDTEIAAAEPMTTDTERASTDHRMVDMLLEPTTAIFLGTDFGKPKPLGDVLEHVSACAAPTPAVSHAAQATAN